MAYFRDIKKKIREYYGLNQENDFAIPEFLVEIPYEKWVNPLFACLLEADLTQKVAYLLGIATSQIYEKDPEKGKTIVRRFIWQMNEESGNIAWGIPQAFVQTLIASRPLCENYYRILISYIRSKEGDGNYCDYALLRYHCLQAVHSLLKVYPEYKEYAKKPLLDALEDPDNKCNKEADFICKSLNFIN